ncbi:unnamed protein product [Cylicocyclus nassatus]|uniref:Cadherin domain-containing protein n=1 Tax=Cylicocyclus nassatus TaxID=53992 RepID=A0AA36DMH0_CYLNA|nr:unnamed protein product [Cylicocyclus nassatus]
MEPADTVSPVKEFWGDVDIGKNAELFYNITDGDSRFTIDESGYIATNVPLKAEEVVTLTIQATDRGLPAQMTQIRAILTAVALLQRTKDAKNQAPSFGKNDGRQIPVSDADQVGFTIAKIEAVDPDGDPIWWSIFGGNMNETFALRPNSGLLQLAKPIESLARNVTNIVLTIKITDGQLNATSGQIAVEVSRLPITRPQFSAQHYKSRFRKKPRVRYPFGGGHQHGGQTSCGANTGNVLMMESLDYEVCREICAIIYARQGTLTNYVTLTVTVTDDNDNAPRFVHKDYSVTLPMRIQM